MSGMEPMMIGAALGAATNRRNPLQGAMLGGVLGGFGGAAMGAGNTAATATMKGAAAIPAGGATTITPMTAGATYSGAAPGMVANFGMPTMPTYAATGGSTGLIGSTTAPVTMMDRLGAMGSFAKNNPMAVNVGLQSANSLLTPPEPLPMSAPPGLARGQQFQMEEPQYAMAQRQPISLI
jgi:hypothetical protein